MDEDKRIKEFVQKDKNIPDRINKTFDNFIDDIRQDKQESKADNVIDFAEKKKSFGILRFKKLIAVAASLLIVIVASNAYARTQGYDNIFFMIIDMTKPKEERNQNEIFADKDIIISYQYIQVAENIELQINELQAKDNSAKLYLLVKELAKNDQTPLNYKVYNEKNELMYEGKSSKKNEERDRYTEVLELSNFRDQVNNIRLEVYNKDNKLLKTVSVKLNEKTIEARTENKELEKISQIELNKFLKQETSKIYSEKEMKDRTLVIIETYDIYYSDGKYTAKYLFMKPTEEEFEKDKVEQTDIYTNTIEFTVNNGVYQKVKIEKPEIR